jgi:hypothetical protein
MRVRVADPGNAATLISTSSSVNVWNAITATGSPSLMRPRNCVPSGKRAWIIPSIHGRRRSP